MFAGMLRAASNLAFLAAAIIAVFTLVSDHSADYGEVTLPGRGVVDLPEGSVEVFYRAAGREDAGGARRLASPVSFRVTPVEGGSPVVANSGRRSVGLGSSGEISTFETEFAGEYRVAGAVPAEQAGASLTFGTDPATAVTRKRDLWIALIGGGLAAAVLAGLLRRVGRDPDRGDRPYDVRPESLMDPADPSYAGAEQQPAAAEQQPAVAEQPGEPQPQRTYYTG